MDLKSILSKSSSTKDNYWSLIIEPQWVSAAIWEIEGDAVKVVATGASSAWEKDQELVNACDTALSSCITNLPDDVKEPNKTVFGVTAEWVDGGTIKEEYLDRLKVVCQELSLEPTGFVVISEAVAHYVKVEEGSPLSAVVVGLAEEKLEVSLYKLGKLAGTTSVARSISVADDLVEGLVRFGTEEAYPSRIIIYNNKEADLENVRQEFTDVDWSAIEKIKFLHTPRVEIINPSDKVVAVCLAGASEMGGVTKIADVPAHELDNLTQPEEKFEASDLGFVVEDAAGASGENPGLGHNAEEGKDANEVMDKLPGQDAPSVSNSEQSQKSGIQFPKLPDLSKVHLPKFSNPIKSSMTANSFKMNSMHGSINNFAKPLIIGGSTLLTFILAGFAFWWFYPKANVTLFVSPKKLDESTTLVLGSELKTRDDEVEVTGQKTKSTTGTKTVGEKAKGTVKVQNGTAFPINLAAGTVLVSASDLRFTLAQAASVSGALTPTSPGTATLDVVASSIGSEYNLGKDEVFKVGNYPKAEVDAVSTADFSGGSSRQISAVDEKDLESLKKDLLAELTEDAKKKFGDKKASDEILVDGLLKTETTEEKFSNKEGDEATTLKLDLTVKVTGKFVAKKDLAAVTSKILEGKVPNGFVVRDDQVTYKFEINEEDDTKIDLDMGVNLLPSIDPNDVAKKIAGKYPSMAENFLKDVPGFVRAEFKINPLFPGKLGTLPHVTKQISVEISAVK